MIRKFTLVAALATLLPSTVFAVENFVLYDVKLGMSLEEVNQHLQDYCTRNCKSYGSNGPAGIFDMTVFLRYQTEYFDNTHRSEVNRRMPFESVTYTFGPDRKVIAMQSEFYGPAAKGKDKFDKMAGLYKGDLREFTEQREKQALVTAKADMSTTHTVTWFEPGVTGKKFQVASWVNPSDLTTVRMNYTDFDAMRKLEDAKPNDFVAFRGRAAVGITPRNPSSYEAANALKFKPITSEVSTKLVAGSDTIEIIPEILDGGQNPPSKLVVNGKVVGTSGLLSDGVSYEGVQKLGHGLYRVAAAWDGNSCGAQQEMILRVIHGKAYLSESFGRCDATVTENDGTVYFSFAETEDEPQSTVAFD